MWMAYIPFELIKVISATLTGVALLVLFGVTLGMVQ